MKDEKNKDFMEAERTSILRAQNLIDMIGLILKKSEGWDGLRVSK